MDEAIAKYYRRLSREGFKYAGSLENPSIFLTDETGERVRVCTSVGSYLHLYINVGNGVITGIKYQGIFHPATHVAIEILCSLVDGKTLDEAGSLTEDAFVRILGDESEELRQKAGSLIQLLQIGIERYHNTAS